jgi:S-formylglutathione hydrolase FrmB
MPMKQLVCVVAIAACGAPAAAPPAVPAPAVAAPGPAVTGPGRVVTEHFHSDALGVDKTVLVYLPAGYDPAAAKRYPVLYYLHGLGGDETNFIEGAHLDRAADALHLQAIVVMPDGDNGFYVDSAMAIDYDACMKTGAHMFMPGQPRPQTCVRASKYETYLTKDVVGWVDRTYKTIATRAGRGIAGVSMGGYGALVLGLRHGDMFAAIASHSGAALRYMGPFPYEKGKVLLNEDPKSWAAGLRLLGLGTLGDWVLAVFGEDIANWRALDPAELAKKLTPGQVKLYFDCGTEDEFQFQHGLAYLHDILLERGIAHEYYVGPGRHAFVFWAERVPKSLAFFAAAVAPAR